MLGFDKAAVTVSRKQVWSLRKGRGQGARFLLHKNSVPQAPLKGDEVGWD